MITALQAQRGHRLPLAAFAYGTGIGVYFALPFEPNVWHLATLALVMLICAALGWWRRMDYGLLWTVFALLAAGVLIAALRTQSVAAPVLGWRYYGPVEGVIVKIDRSASHRPRVTLKDPRLLDIAPDKTPALVRLSFDPKDLHFDLVSGQTIAATAFLSPPQGPTEPGGFDFQRHAWFLSIGAFGYSRAPPVLLDPAPKGFSIARIRQALGAGLLDHMPAETAGVAMALAIGDRTEIAQDTLKALRASNLAHLLAISGLHVGLLTGTIFFASRLILSVCSGVAPRVSPKKAAACIALASATVYLLISGMSVATQRAYIMAVVMLCALLLDRRALTLRAVALAGFIILTLRPESLTGPGFQMSFAATIALVLAFRHLRQTRLGRRSWAAPLIAVVVSSFVAGLATAPFSAAHFNMVGQYGLLANVLSVPVMGFWVMPCLICAAFLAPLDLHAVPLWGVHYGISWILWVAEFVAGLEGAERYFTAPPGFVLPLFTVGALWVVLWQGRLRWLGCVLSIAVLGLWSTAKRPELLIAESGRLLGLLTPDGRVLSRNRGERFVAQTWLAADGQGILQGELNEATIDWSDMDIGPYRVSLLTQQPNLSDIARLCEQENLIVLAAEEDSLPVPCSPLTPKILQRTGASAIYKDGRVITARAQQGERPWVPKGSLKIYQP